jgi:hypothetical protein
MLLFGMTKFFTCFFVTCLIFQAAAVTSAAWIVLFSYQLPDAPAGISDSSQQTNGDDE